jgi:hypothetical protein
MEKQAISLLFCIPLFFMEVKEMMIACKSCMLLEHK